MNKVPQWESRTVKWDLAAADRLPEFLALLPPPLAKKTELVVNEKGGTASLSTWNYSEKNPGEKPLFHGTTYLGVPSILTQGFMASSVEGVHEFTVPGVYLADALHGSLYYHATATNFDVDGTDWRAPYVRFVFTVRALGPPIKVKSYGRGCQQLIFAEDKVEPIDLLIYRGWNFCDSGEKIMKWKPAVAAIPAAPPVLWREALCEPDAWDEVFSYFWHVDTRETTWRVPLEGYIPACVSHERLLFWC